MDVYFAPTVKEIVSLECDELRDLTNTTFEAITKIGEEFEKRLDERTAGLSEKERIAIEESVTDRAFMLYDRHPARLIKACFLTAYCFLEDQFVEIALMEGHARRLELTPFDLNKEGIEAARKFLHKACGFEMPNGGEWQRLLFARRLRNSIVHNGGRCIKDTGLAKEISKYDAQLLWLDERQRIRLTTKFCISVINDIEAFLIDVIDATTID